MELRLSPAIVASDAAPPVVLPPPLLPDNQSSSLSRSSLGPSRQSPGQSPSGSPIIAPQSPRSPQSGAPPSGPSSPLGPTPSSPSTRPTPAVAGLGGPSLLAASPGARAAAGFAINESDPPHEILGAGARPGDDPDGVTMLAAEAPAAAALFVRLLRWCASRATMLPHVSIPILLLAIS